MGWWKRLRHGAIALSLALSGHLALASYNLTITTNDASTGAIVAEQHHHNLVTTAGLNLIRDLMAATFVGVTTNGITHLAVGTGSTAPVLADTTLVAEVARGAVTNETKSAGTLTVSYYLPSGTANGSTLAEAGLFNAASAGAMYARALISPTIAKTSAVTVTFTWILTWS